MGLLDGVLSKLPCLWSCPSVFSEFLSGVNRMIKSDKAGIGNLIKGIGGSRVEKICFFISAYVVVLSLCLPKWAHLSLNSNYCRSYGTKRIKD